MMHSNLLQTLFNIEKSKNAVNVGSGSAYQIYTSPGKPLGRIGTVVDPTSQIPANDDVFPPKTPACPVEINNDSWFRRVLAALRR